ncbi:MAG: penicillin acylase family protein, partial [Acidobacteriota bacterium]
LPIAGGRIGMLFDFYARPERGQKRRYGITGNSFVSIVEFGPQIRALSISVFGQSADPASQHYFDQAQLYAKHKFKIAWFTLDEVKANSAPPYHPGEHKERKAA